MLTAMLSDTGKRQRLGPGSREVKSRLYGCYLTGSRQMRQLQTSQASRAAMMEWREVRLVGVTVYATGECGRNLFILMDVLGICCRHVSEGACVGTRALS